MNKNSKIKREQTNGEVMESLCKYLTSKDMATNTLVQLHWQRCTILESLAFTHNLPSLFFLFFSQVNASVKVKVRGSGVLLASGGMMTCVAVYVQQIVLGVSPWTPTPACVSAERVHSHVCGRARGSTQTPAGKFKEKVLNLWMTLNFSATCNKTMPPLGDEIIPSIHTLGLSPTLRTPYAPSQKKQWINTHFGHKNGYVSAKRTSIKQFLWSLLITLFNHSREFRPTSTLNPSWSVLNIKWLTVCL